MQVVDVEEMTDGQLEFADRELNRKFWRSVIQTGIPLLVFVAIWTGVIDLPLDKAPAVLVSMFHGLVMVCAILSGIATFLMPTLCIKAQAEVRRETLRRGIGQT